MIVNEITEITEIKMLQMKHGESLKSGGVGYLIEVIRLYDYLFLFVSKGSNNHVLKLQAPQSEYGKRCILSAIDKHLSEIYD